jgi:predicted ATPase
MADRPAGTVTLLFTDIEGSTRLLEELGDDYADALDRHRRILREAFARHGGVEVDTQGDAFFVSFARASDALAAATEARDALTGGPVRVRIGVHTGEPTVTGEGYVGMDVHRAARIAAVGHGGQILVSQTTRDLVGGDGLRDLGEHRLKDLPVPERIYQLGDGEFPPLRAPRPGNVPRPAEALVGRKKELIDLLRLIRGGRARIVTVTGPGGIGKTRLATEVAAELEDAFADGVWFIDLAPLADSSLVLPTIAATIGARGELERHLADRQLLLVLDNFEHLLDAAPDVAVAVGNAEGVGVVATSRAPLKVAGEREYPLRPLAESPAIELFRTRAEAVAADFDADYAQLAELCKRLDRLPLAIELAAARASLLPAATLVERLEQRLPLLTGGRRDAPERHRTLHATIDWSYQLLSPREQEVFAALAVFAGGCTIEAAEEVCGAELDTLQSLLEESLLRRGDDRIAMLETIREYALARLDEREEADELRRRHAFHFLELVERADAEWEGHQSRWIARLAEDYDNLRAALAWTRHAEEDIFGRLVAALGHLWAIRGLFGEGRRWVDEALALREWDPGLRDRILRVGSGLAALQGELDHAERLCEQRYALARAWGDEHAIAGSAINVGVIALQRSDYARARTFFEEGLALFRRLEMPEQVGVALLDLAEVAVWEREFDEAAAYLDESMDLLRAANSEGGMAHCSHTRGLLAVWSGRLADAAEPFAMSARLFRSLPHPVGVALSLHGLAAVAADAGEHERAARVLGAADRLLTETGTTLHGTDRELYEGVLGPVRAELGPGLLERAWNEGRALSLDEAVDYALAGLD